ncbi:CvpA family protein [Sporolactobacillus sp. THM7-7]|nr:CvpA family protein [Sporolactobacillus sp. THM7-7]
MLLNIIILLLLAVGFFNGFRRGLVLQLVHLAGFIISLIVAWMYFKPFAQVLKLWIPYPSSVARSDLFDFLGNLDLQAAYYQAMAFIILFLAAKIVINILGSMLDFLAEVPLIRPVNHLSGGLLGFAEIYLIVFLLLYVGALTPMDGIQSSIEQSMLAQSMIDHTPVFSEVFRNLWVALISI